MSATGTKDDQLPLISTISGLKTCQSPLTRVTKSVQHGTKSSSVADLLRKKLLERMKTLGVSRNLSSFLFILFLFLLLTQFCFSVSSVPAWSIIYIFIKIPHLCSVSQGLQVLFGLYSLVLGSLLSSSLALWQDANVNFPHWPGGLLVGNLLLASSF